MQAACSIKQTELDNKRRKFELLPAFLKAGVYYSTKLEAVRHPDIGYFQRFFSFDLIMRDAKSDYLNNNFESACRKYEEVTTLSNHLCCLCRRTLFGTFTSLKTRTGKMKELKTSTSKRSIGKDRQV